jgi:hypothetical protein
MPVPREWRVPRRRRRLGEPEDVEAFHEVDQQQGCAVLAG